MPTIQEVRKKFPQYDNMSDQELADAIHKKFYSDLPREEFDAKLGMTPANQELERKAIEQADQIEKLGGKTGASDLYGNQFTFGLQDKVAGLSSGLGSLIKGEGFGEGYKVGQRAQEILEERARQRSGNWGKAAEIAGGVSTGFLARAPMAVSTLGRVAQAGKESAILGGLSSAGNSQGGPNETLPEAAMRTGRDALTGAAVSGVLGAGMSGVVEAGRGVFNGLRAGARAVGSAMDDEAGRAGRKVYGALQADGMTPQQATARMATRDTALINTADENVLGLGRAVSATPGPGRTIVNKALDAQQKASKGKIMEAVNKELGGSDMPLAHRIADLVKSRSTNGSKLYDAAFKQNFANGHSMKFDGLQDRIPAHAFKTAQQIAAAEGRPFGQQLVANVGDSGSVTFTRVPSLEEWHYIQRGLRGAKDAAYKAGLGELGTAYKNLHKELLDAMDAASPIYKQARSTYASQSQMIEALQKGREILNPANTRNVDFLADDIAKMSKSEKEVMRMGLARQMEDMLRDTPDKAGDMVKKIFGTEAKRNAIKAAFGDDAAFRRFEAKMGQIAKETDTYRFIRQGSRTSFVDAEKAGASAIGEVGADLLQNGAANATVNAVGKLLKSMGGMDDGVAAEVARILVSRDPKAVMAALKPAANRAAAQASRQKVFDAAQAIARGLTVGGSATAGAQAPAVLGDMY